MSGGYLLDSCTMLWLATEPGRLSERARAILDENHASLFVSAISAFEIAAKNARGALKLPMPATEWFPETVRTYKLRTVPVSSRIALRAATLPRHHRDPFDRIIIATAQLRGVDVVTPDPAFRHYDVRLSW